MFINHVTDWAIKSMNEENCQFYTQFESIVKRVGGLDLKALKALQSSIWLNALFYKIKAQ